MSQAASTFLFMVDIHGRAGRVTLRGWSFLQCEIEVSSSVNTRFTQPSVIHPQVEGDNITMMLVPELEEFARVVQEECEPSGTATDGRHVLRALDGLLHRIAKTLP